MRNLLGGKGANLAEMARLKLPVPPGFTISTKVCNYFYDHGHKYPKGLTDGRGEERRAGREGAWAQVRRREESAAGVGAIGRARFDAGNDGHGAEPRAHRRDGAGPCGNQRQPALCLGLVPALLPDVRRRGAQAEAGEQERSRSVRGNYRSQKSDARGQERYRPERRRFAGTGRRVPLTDSIARRARHPAGPARATVDGNRRGVRLVAQRSRDHVPEDQQYPGRLGHRGHGAIDGVRKSRRRLRDRRRVHARSRHRRERNLRRVSAQRAGRGRRRGNPHRAADKPEGGAGMGQARGNQRGRACVAIPDARGKLPRGLQTAPANLGAARKAFSRHAGHGIYDRAQSAVHAADAQRQADSAGRGANRGGHGRRETDRSQDGAEAGRAGTARAVFASAAGSVEQETRDRARTAGLAGRSQWRSGVLGG